MKFLKNVLRILLLAMICLVVFALIAIIGKIVPDTIGEPMTVGAAMGAVTVLFVRHGGYGNNASKEIATPRFQQETWGLLL